MRHVPTKLFAATILCLAGTSLCAQPNTNSSQNHHFVEAHCAAMYDHQADVAKCVTQNRQCEASANDAAKALCACNSPGTTRIKFREQCFEAAFRVIAQDKTLKSAAALDQKVPHCDHLKPKDGTSALDPDPRYANCLKNAFFDTNLALQQVKNQKGWQEYRQNQEFEQDVRNAELQQENDNDFWHH
jgi:hypothetical protein